MWVDCLWPIHFSQLTIRRSAAFRAAPSAGGRSLAVFSEGGDPRPLEDPESYSNPEACETGGLGLTVSRGAVRWNTTEAPLRERV